ncbi:MAG: hypothetical protein KKC68_01235 [Candidatus Thermoplasmatota archaeon]|nr:hypothetical protein [Candidatus Thermoplasmatota archaeon]MBU1940374.1 hypothetical protein [Candidatus Thermoplasmatota archaeon]
MKIVGVVLLICLLVSSSGAIAFESRLVDSTDRLPASFSWLDVDGVNYMPPVKNQIPAPTCEAYALCTTLETLVNYETGAPYNCDLSEAHLFFYSGGTCNWGVDIKDALEYLEVFGVPDEGCFPDHHRPHDEPFASLLGWENRSVKISGWGWVPNEVDAIKDALIEHGPLIICMLVRPDFTNYRRGIYRPGPYDVTGGHVINIVGYDDTQQCWLIRNSWGDAWGEDGYIRVAYNAHTEERPFIWPFYGGTGIAYIAGVYGMLDPDVPKIWLTNCNIQHTCFLGFEFPSLKFRIDGIQLGAPRVFGPHTIQLETANTDYVEFYLDQELLYTDTSPPFSWKVEGSKGLHTLEIYAYNNQNMSMAFRDIFLIFPLR